MPLQEFKADLHLHTCLSPCGELEMVPPAIADRAHEVGLDLIAICDHNATENVQAVRAASSLKGVNVIGGMEVTSIEEVHLVVLMEDESLSEMQSYVYAHLTGENDQEHFGMQVIVDDAGTPTEINDHLLIGATDLTLEQIVNQAHALKGLVIASHVDREGFSIVGQLGFIPPSLKLDALELSTRASKEEESQFEKQGLPIIRSSDAHRLIEMGRACTTFLLNEPTFAELRLAFRGEGGRAVKAR